MARKKEIPEKVSGGYAAIPHAVFDSASFAGASDKAKALLIAVIRQLNGRNNGHLQLTTKWLRQNGYTCPENNIKARKELVERGLIVQTKLGGLNMGADLFAVTWLDITNPVGLDITIQGFPRGAYLLCKLPPTPKRKAPAKKDRLFDDRNSAVTTTVADGQSAVTTTVTKNALFEQSAVTTTVNNVNIPIHIRKNRIAAVSSRVVGKKKMSELSVGYVMSASLH